MPICHCCSDFFQFFNQSISNKLICLLPNDKEKMYYAKDERGVLFRFGDFLGGRMDEIIFDELLIDKHQLMSAVPAIFS
jgi:hypothetical protein